MVTLQGGGLETAGHDLPHDEHTQLIIRHLGHCTSTGEEVVCWKEPATRGLLGPTSQPQPRSTNVFTMCSSISTSLKVTVMSQMSDSVPLQKLEETISSAVGEESGSTLSSSSSGSCQILHTCSS